MLAAARSKVNWAGVNGRESLYFSIKGLIKIEVRKGLIKGAQCRIIASGYYIFTPADLR